MSDYNISVRDIDDLNALTARFADQRVDMSRMLYMLYQDVELQITRADLKAQIILSTTAVFTAVFAGIGLPSEFNEFDLQSQIAFITSNGIMFFALLASAWFAITASYPRLIASTPPEEQQKNLYFFGHIRLFQPSDYVDQFMNAAPPDIKSAALRTIHAKSTVLEQKYRMVQRSMVALILAMFMLGLAQFIIAIH